MGKLKDLTGQRFGRLLVVSRAGITTDGKAVWLCLCDCGTSHEVSGRRLRLGQTKSCGCLNRDVQAAKRLRLEGRRFGKLVVKRLSGVVNGNTRWVCACSCGNTVVVLGASLVRGATKSCGCSREVALVGHKFGRLLVIDRAVSNGDYERKWLCACDCGGRAVVTTYMLQSGHTRSCGCLTRTVDGRSGEDLYNRWSTMIDRCYNDQNISYSNYGGRGISVCRRWHKYNNYADDVGIPPSSDCSLDRIDNSGDYTPGNVRWSTAKQQARNTRRNYNLEYNSRMQCLAAWCEELGLPYKKVWYRLRRLGWSPAKAFTATYD